MSSRGIRGASVGRNSLALVAVALTSVLMVPATLAIAVDEPSTGSAVVFVVTRPERAAGEFVFSDPRDPTGASTVSGSDRIEIDGLTPGRHSVSFVDAPAGWLVEGWTCTDGGLQGSSFDGDTAMFDIHAGEEAVCFWRALAPGAANVFVRDDSGNDRAAFVFTDPRQPTGEATSAVAGSRLLEFAPVTPELHLVELVEQTGGIDVEGWVCTDWGAGHSEFLDVNLVAFDIQPGEEVTCFWKAGPAGAIEVVALTDPPDIEGTFVFDDISDPADGATVSLSSGMPQTFLDLPQGRYSVTLVDHPDELTLRTIACHHPSEQSSSLISLDTRTALVETDAGGTVICLFRFELGPIGGGGGDGGAVPDADGDSTSDADVPEPEAASTAIVPRAGRWRVTNHATTVRCPGAPNQRLAEEIRTGRISVRDDGATLVGRDILDGQTAPIRVRLRDAATSRYDGRVRIRGSGARVNLTLDLTALSRERIVGTLTGTVRVGRVACVVMRDVEFDFAGGTG